MNNLIKNIKVSNLLLHHYPGITYIFDLLDNKNTFINNKVEEILGYNADEVKNFGGRLLHDLMHPEDYKNYLESIVPQYSCLKENDYIDHDYRLRTKDGSYIWLHTREIVIKCSKDNKASQILGIAHDFTKIIKKEKNLERLNKRCNAIISNFPNSTVAVIDKNLKYVHFYGKALQKIGLGPQDFIGKSVKEILPEDASVIAYDNQLKIFKGEQCYYEFEVNGKIFANWGELVKYHNENTEEAVIFTIDITQRKHMEKALRDSQRRLLLATKTAGIGVWDWNLLTGNMVWDDSILTMYGFKKKPKDYNLEVWKKCIHPDDRDFVIESCLAAHRGEKDYNLEFRIVWPDNSIHWIKADGIVIYNISNEAVRMIGTNYDITELKLSQKKLESSYKELNSQTAKLIESEERFREFVDTINTGVAVYKVINEGQTGNDYIIKDFNRYALEHENKVKDDVVGKKLKDIRPSIDDYGLIDIFRQVWITGEPAFFPAKIYIDDNFSNYYENRVFKLPSGEIVAVYDDVSERVKAEQELIAAKEKAEESDRLKSAFLANMSHEIRTPMNGILNFSSLLSYPDFSQEKKNDFIQIIQKSGSRLINTLDDIIEISKIEVGECKITKKNINFNENIRDIISFFSKEALDKGLEVELVRPNEGDIDTLHTDGSKFQTIITNLIKNAIKFSDSGKITFGYELIAGEIKFFCKDQGIGIHSDRTEGIFNRFEQADLNNTRGYEGSGLGLAIAKAYVEMLGGRIWLESVVNEGSTFFFTLPLTMQSFKPLVKQISLNKTQKSNTLTNRKVNILVVEDDAISASYLQIVLEKYCDNLYSVRTGQEAIDIIKKHPNIDLVLMDIKLPVMDGYETTRKIREFNERVKIIAQTAYAFKRDRNKAIDAGCDDYITKPLARNKLLKIINKQLDNELLHP